MENMYLNWECPSCKKLIALERKAPIELRRCTVFGDKIVCSIKMPSQQVRDELVKDEFLKKLYGVMY